ncbi:MULTISPECIES: tripartite tricarboxylate transporter substrate binding protein [unclassified Pigmentiphaga]|uniref:tripartite tricarboxylate transporter substrate binding protein n=1 Tax=unclassified Pigmentiphaga TaxID=2626614 RepID=UPI000B41CD20|nr:MULTISPECIES: tripartite tricarboxylate transporter substrate binding protein [unclassified Pigmentiphaga]OVZ60966.1 hypothetical protein CDO46_21515 [Pigmentiphaga sp. NML030171]
MPSLLSRLAASVAALAATSAIAAGYPDKPVRVIVPYVAGSPADMVARKLGEGLAQQLGQSFIVENKAGANGMIGSEFVARAAPDGYTIMLGNMDTHALNPLLYRHIRYEPARDFAPVAQVGTLTAMLIARPDAPFQDARGLIQAAARAPGKLTYGSWGLGSVAHLWGGLLEESGRIQLMHVPYQGTPAAMNALMGSQIDLLFGPPTLALANAKNGRLKILGVTSATRQPQYPDVPTLAEQGFAGYDGTTWFGVFAPAKVPGDVLERLNQAINRTLDSPAMADTAATLAMTVTPGDRRQLERTMAASREKWGRIIADKKIQLND